MYSIIIADIAPKIPGDLTHFNWPGCCEIGPSTGFITRPTIIWLKRARYVNLETENEMKKSIFVGLIMMLN